MKMHADLHWAIKPFDALTPKELHDLLRLRVDIFVLEQACAYAEIDGRDPQAWHVMAYDAGGTLVGYARILPPEIAGLPHVGRVVVQKEQRGTGLGHDLMRHCLHFLQQQFGSPRSELAAQPPPETFYAPPGDVRVSDEYPWDGIPHVDMRISG